MFRLRLSGKYTSTTSEYNEITDFIKSYEAKGIFRYSKIKSFPIKGNNLEGIEWSFGIKHKDIDYIILLAPMASGSFWCIFKGKSQYYRIDKQETIASDVSKAISFIKKWLDFAIEGAELNPDKWMASKHLAENKKVVSIDEYLDLPMREAKKCVVQPKTREELKEVVKKAVAELGNDADLNFIDTHHITNMGGMFYESQFNGDISKWDVSKVTSMGSMFYGSKFNGDISKWDVSNVETMAQMFSGSQFNGDISKWNVSSVEDMICMFVHSKFNGDISKWDVSNVTKMTGMFEDSQFNGDISNWNVSNVKDMWDMFSGSQFNGDISKWDVSNVENMANMFHRAKFNGNLDSWNISSDCYTYEMFRGSPLIRKYGVDAEKLKK